MDLLHMHVLWTKRQFKCGLAQLLLYILKHMGIFYCTCTVDQDTINYRQHYSTLGAFLSCVFSQELQSEAWSIWLLPLRWERCNNIGDIRTAGSGFGSQNQHYRVWLTSVKACWGGGALPFLFVNKKGC
jgi:hypothetical protein